MNGGKHCYPGSEFLINKYNIYDKQLLENLEIQKVTVKLLGLDINPDRIEYTYDVYCNCKSERRYLETKNS